MARVADNDTPLALGGQVPGVQVHSVFIPAEGTAGDTDKWPLFVADHDVKITKVEWIPGAAVTGAATNNFAFAVQNVGKVGTGSTAVTTTKTYANGTDSVALKPETYTLHTTVANRDVDKGEVVALVRTINGTGLASPEGVIVVHCITQ